MKSIIIGGVIFVLAFWHWYSAPSYVVKNDLGIEDLVVNPENMERAIQKMGPYYQYRIEPDGTLRVQLNDKWLVLKYEDPS